MSRYFTKKIVRTSYLWQQVLFALIFCTLVVADPKTPPTHVNTAIDWPVFMSRQDMVWDRAPTRWEDGPYLGNGMLGLIMFQNPKSPKNEFELHVGRGDYYDNRPPVDGKENTWIYRGRLPIGYFKISSRGIVKGVDWRLDLWNAELKGTVTTDKGSYKLHALVQSQYDSFYVNLTDDLGERVVIEWVPQEAYSYSRQVSEKAVDQMNKLGKKPFELYVNFASIPYPKAPTVELSQVDGIHFSRQILHANSGELVTSWKQIEEPSSRKQTLVGSISFSHNVGENNINALQNIQKSLDEINSSTYIANHRKWWHEYYQKSFLSLSDAFWEEFYWIQMYKFASATRSNGMCIDTFGPWYQPGFWPMIWTNLNVQLTYWTTLAANRLDVAESLPNQMDKYAKNLIQNAPLEWQEDCLNADTIFPADMKGKVGKKESDHIVWMLHNYWLWCRYADDESRMKEGLFPLLKRANMVYFRYIKEFPMVDADGTIHIKNTWSPEYPGAGGRGQDIHYTLALIRWSCQTLLDISHKHGLNDPMEKQWQHLLDKLVEFPTDDNGLRVGKDLPFDIAHRHYSHLLAFYPLYVLSPDKDAPLLKKSTDHWLEVTKRNDNNKGGATPVCSYTCTGAASMYASLKDGNTALSYLKLLPTHKVSPTTMYSEGSPCIESPFSAATSIHDMLLQSWDGRLRIFPAMPDSWKDLHFRTLRAQGGILVSGYRSGGKNCLIMLESPHKPKEVEFTVDLEKPVFTLFSDGSENKKLQLQRQANGFYKVKLETNERLVAVAQGTSLQDCKTICSPIDIKNIFGLNSLYEEITGTGGAVRYNFEPVSARYLRIAISSGQPLSLAEVQVFEKSINVAENAKASQSSTSCGGIASRAVDGNCNSNYDADSVTHTHENNPDGWWEVDLGRMVAIDKIIIFNRDQNSDRLNGFTLSLLKDGDRSLAWEKKGCEQGNKIIFSKQ